MSTFDNRTTRTRFIIRTSHRPENLNIVGVRKYSETPGYTRITKNVEIIREQVEKPEGLYVISVAARLLAMHPQTLRKYERAGLISPTRTVGMLRLYSEEDIVRLRLIKHLVDDLGLNIAGVNLVLTLFDKLINVAGQLDDLSPDKTRNILNDHLSDIFALLNSEK